MKRSNLDDMLICDVALAEGGYNFYGYLSSGADSRFIILRETTGETEYRYAFGKAADYAAAWAARATTTEFRLPSALGGKD